VIPEEGEERIDSSGESADTLSEKDKRIVFLNIPEKIGKGGAVVKGFRKASKELIGFTDADTSTSPEQFEKLVKAIISGNFDACIASRNLKDSIVPGKQPFFRVFLGKSFSWIVRVLFGFGIKDTQCGAKVFRKKPLKSILSCLKVKGWEFDVELLWKLSKKGCSIAEVPITWIDANIGIHQSGPGLVRPITGVFASPNPFRQTTRIFLPSGSKLLPGLPISSTNKGSSF